MVVLILADDHDVGARALACRLGQRAILAPPRLLSQPGWTWVPDPCLRTGSRATGGFSVRELTAVVTRLTAVFPWHVPHVAAHDREFVAAEMTAFLRAWLTALPCPVLNPPSNLCLTGPAWSPEQWAILAHRLGIPATPTIRAVAARTTPQAPGRRAGCRVVVACDRVVIAEPCAAILGVHAAMIARAAGCALLAVDFDTPEPSGCLVNADCWPNLADPAILAAVADCVVLTSRDAPT